MFGALNAGLTGTPSLTGFKSKGEVIKYAIEFTARSKDGEKIINYPAAEELYRFICKHIELPDTFDDGLSSFFQRVAETIEEEERNKEELKKFDRGISGERIAEHLEQVVELPKGKLRLIYNEFVSQCVANGLHAFRGEGHPGYMRECFTRDEKGEYIRVTLEHCIAPQPDKK